MSEKEFSDKFDALLNSYKTSVPYGYEQGNFDFTLNEYEKSLYLTQSQEQYVENYFTSTTDIDSTFEGTEKARKSLEALVRDRYLEEDTTERRHIVKDSQFFKVADDVWFTVYEAVEYNTENGDCVVLPDCINSSVQDLGAAYTTVLPITHDDFYRTYHNPFRGVTNKRALRLTAGEKLYEVVSKYPINKYLIRYVKRPNPIILETLPDGLTIEGKSGMQTCQLDESLHDTILSMAVQLALNYHRLTASSSTSQPQTTTKSSKDDND